MSGLHQYLPIFSPAPESLSSSSANEIMAKFMKSKLKLSIGTIVTQCHCDFCGAYDMPKYLAGNYFNSTKHSIIISDIITFMIIDCHDLHAGFAV